MEPVEQIGLVVVDVLSVYVITDLVQIYFPFSHVGGVVLHEPPTKELEEVDRYYSSTMLDIPLPSSPVLPLPPVIQAGLVSIDEPSVYTTLVLLQMYFPSTQVGEFVDHEPPEREVEELDR